MHTENYVRDVERYFDPYVRQCRHQASFVHIRILQVERCRMHQRRPCYVFLTGSALCAVVEVDHTIDIAFSAITSPLHCFPITMAVRLITGYPLTTGHVFENSASISELNVFHGFHLKIMEQHLVI